MTNPYKFNGRGKKRYASIQTPIRLSEWLYQLLKGHVSGRVILDPCIGGGNLTKPWEHDFEIVVGVDIDRQSRLWCDMFFHGEYQSLTDWSEDYWPDFVICNPPYGGAGGAQMLPEVFLRQTCKLFGTDLPIVLFVPFGFRFNQKTQSKRWRWLRDHGPKLTSIITLPSNVFGVVSVFAEILIFNVPKLETHYFLDDFALTKT